MFYPCTQTPSHPPPPQPLSITKCLSRPMVVSGEICHFLWHKARSELYHLPFCFALCSAVSPWDGKEKIKEIMQELNIQKWD